MSLPPLENRTRSTDPLAGEVCVDASLALMWVLEDEFSESARGLALEWVRQQAKLLAPPLFRAEVTSVIRREVHRRVIRQERAEAALTESFAWPVAIWEDGDNLQRTAFNLATQHNRPKAYDAQYLAVASFLSCEFWTGDERLYNAVSAELPWVRWIGDYRP